MYIFRRYKGIGSLSNLQTASDVVINSRAPSSKPQHHVIHNTYSFKNFSNSHDRNKIYELKKSSSTGTTNVLKKYDTLDSSLSSNSKEVSERRSRSVNLGGILDVFKNKSTLR